MNREVTENIEVIRKNGDIFAIVIRVGFRENGVTFFTPGDFSQQLGYMRHPAGKKIEAHVHNEVQREVSLTQEVLYIKKGRLKVDLYSAERDYVSSVVLEAGDVILLASGGHGFEVLEEVEMIEVKQGPYIDDQDKTHFEPKPKP